MENSSLDVSLYGRYCLFETNLALGHPRPAVFVLCILSKPRYVLLGSTLRMYSN